MALTVIIFLMFAAMLALASEETLDTISNNAVMDFRHVHEEFQKGTDATQQKNSDIIAREFAHANNAPCNEEAMSALKSEAAQINDECTGRRLEVESKIVNNTVDLLTKAQDVAKKLSTCKKYPDTEKCARLLSKMSLEILLSVLTTLREKSMSAIEYIRGEIDTCLRYESAHIIKDLREMDSCK